VKVGGEDNSHTGDEEGKIMIIKHRVQYISGWNSWNVKMGPG